MNKEHVQMGQTVCREGDPVYLLSEGYAYCVVDYDPDYYYLYRLTKPLTPTLRWLPFYIYEGLEALAGRCGEKEVFIFNDMFESKGRMLKEVERDMELGSGQPLEAPTYAEWLATVS